MHSTLQARWGRRFWQSLLVLAAVVLGLGLPACKDPNPGGLGIEKLYPVFEISSSDLDFQEIRVGTWFFRGLTVGNYGRANLELSSFQIEDDARAAFQVELDQSFIEPGGTATIKITYTPPNEGEDSATLVFQTNDPDADEVSVSLRGFGTIPGLVLNPPPPYTFNEVPVDGASYVDVLVTNGGTGKLSLYDISIPAEYSDLFTVDVRGTFESGKQIGPGDLVGITLGYHPKAETDETADAGLLVIESDDPRKSRYEAALLGSTRAEPIDLPPTVRFITPDPDAIDIASRYVGKPLVFEAVVEDSEDSPEDLSVTWLSSVDGKIGVSSPDADGNVSLVTSELSVGEHIIRAFVYDTSGQVGKAEINVKIWNEESEFNYIIAGYDPNFDETSLRYFSVDDNIEIYRVDGVTGDSTPCLVVFDDILNNLSPVVCNAHIGDKIRISVYDRYAERGQISGLNLFFGEDKQRLIEPYVVNTGASTNSEACPDSPYKGPWYTEHSEPYTNDCLFLDVEVEVTIPVTPTDG